MIANESQKNNSMAKETLKLDKEQADTIFFSMVYKVWQKTWNRRHGGLFIYWQKMFFCIKAICYIKKRNKRVGAEEDYVQNNQKNAH